MDPQWGADAGTHGGLLLSRTNLFCYPNMEASNSSATQIRGDVASNLRSAVIFDFAKGRSILREMSSAKAMSETYPELPS